jgi:hypothetical protein
MTVTETETADKRRWFGVLAPEGVKSGDRRRFREGSLRMRSLPLPLTWQKVSAPGHEGSVTVASIQEVWREGGLIWGAGEVMDTPEADEWAGLVAHFGRYGVSIDADDIDEFSIELAEDGTTDFLDARVCSASTVGIPAFAEAFVMLGNHEDFAADFAGGWGAPSQEIPTREDEGQDECEHRDEDGNCVEREPDAEKKTMAAEEPVIHYNNGEEFVVEEEPAPCSCDEEAENYDPNCDCDEAPEDDITVPDSVKVNLDGLVEFKDLAPGRTEDGPGWLTHPVDTDRLRDYWVHDPEGLIGWGTPDDFYRCEAALAEYVKPQYLKGYCANRHYDALGYWPGQPPHQGVTMTASASTITMNGVQITNGTTLTIPGVGSLVAAGPRPAEELPKTWFEDPALEGPTPLTVTDEGRVFGHLATWGQCHIGFDGECILLPRSNSDYSYYQCGIVDTQAGPVRTGVISLGGGHAGPGLSWRAAMEHYDSTSTAVADICVGEDDHGVWMAGAIRAGVSDSQIRELKAAGKASGDWREVVRGSDELELVAALGVNVGGFPVPRVQIAASAGHITSLVAAGVVMDDPIGDLTDAIIERMEQRQAERAALEAAKADLEARVVPEMSGALRARLGGEE